MGFPDGHVGTALPATLVTLNTFASHILFGGTTALKPTETPHVGGAKTRNV